MVLQPLRKCLQLLALLVGLFFASLAQAEVTPPDQLVKQITQETYVYVNQDASLQKGDISKLIEWAEKSVLKDFDFNRMKTGVRQLRSSKSNWFMNSASC